MRNLQALVRYNAQRCAQARTPHCRCHCGGRFHGRAHSEAWIEQTALDFVKRGAPQRELFEFDDDDDDHPEE